ncbi:lysophospholipase [Schizosaccharomyces cryophilus OY26]|uniref:Lysophospholipase n=1 Tax=Schizosaccharomyces cryophilus (strain OY26 / ATCC MYA-4695 / CBS 11777 / NBRC 106824 / NRRL Y48691) TaxID=653667 RepID=S9VXW2_SCHCR|nr:lysophospholipase [Schizosaccharomyces cryophilus OY26]EPY50805.1 lysophospholipase [Schizosaccharomyces cryophilus OY26]
MNLLFSSILVFVVSQIITALPQEPFLERALDSSYEQVPDLSPEAVELATRYVEATRMQKRDDTSSKYAPYNVTCPNDLLRDGSKGISDGEQSYLNKRIDSVNKLTREFVQNAGLNISVNDVITEKDGPRLGIAFSGGGFRAMLNGAGFFDAFDSRSQNSSKFTGLMQSSMYISGLSGGSWLVGSIAVNNFSNITYLKDNVWDMEHSVFAPHSNPIKLGLYYNHLREEIDAKQDAGFDTSITDLWGRSLARKLVDAPRGGPGITWSSIRNQSWFENAEYPYPIIISDSRREDEHIIPENSTIFEFTPYEFGSWDNGINAFIPMEYVGTHLNNGVPPNNQCVRGFDDAGFVMGSSATLFNEALLRLNSNSTLGHLAEDILQHISENQNDIAPYPNPFQNYTAKNSTVANNFKNYPTVDLVDGGEDNQNIPLWPLLHPQRFVDVIFAVDSTADDNSWPTGSSLVNTYERVTGVNGNKSIDVRGFPYVPDENTFVSKGLNTRPTFFGCDGKNTTLKQNYVDNKTPPLVVYMPNYPWDFDSNISTFTFDLSNEKTEAVINNARVAATQNNSDDFATCLACAVVQRSLERKNMSTPERCKTCFQQYCWDGSVASIKATDYNPTILSTKDSSSASRTVSLGLSSILLSLVPFVFLIA